MSICVVFPVLHVYFVTVLTTQSALYILNALSDLLNLELPQMKCPLAKTVQEITYLKLLSACPRYLKQARRIIQYKYLILLTKLKNGLKRIP